MVPNLPDFKKMSDREIAKFWDEHDTVDFWPEMTAEEKPFVDKQPKKAISMRFDVETLEQLRRIAESKGISYQTLIRMWIMERLKQEVSLLDRRRATLQ